MSYFYSVFTASELFEKKLLGIIFHVFIISRELGISCGIGINIVTKALHGGIVIEVNVLHGKIKIIK